MTTRGIPFQPWKAALIAKLKPGAVIMTRRIIKWPEWANPEDHLYHLKRTGGIALYVDGRPVKTFGCPWGVPGDRLYVREAYRFHYHCDNRKPSSVGKGAPIHYEGDGNGNPPEWTGKYRPAMHHPKIFSRSGLLVRAVRVEKVQAISVEDCIDEGWPWPPGEGWVAELNDSLTKLTAREWFRVLWDSFYAGTKNAWDKNPFVWVITAEKE